MSLVSDTRVLSPASRANHVALQFMPFGPQNGLRAHAQAQHLACTTTGHDFSVVPAILQESCGRERRCQLRSASRDARVNMARAKYMF